MKGRPPEKPVAGLMFIVRVTVSSAFLNYKLASRTSVMIVVMLAPEGQMAIQRPQPVQRGLP